MTESCPSQIFVSADVRNFNRLQSKDRDRKLIAGPLFAVEIILALEKLRNVTDGKLLNIISFPWKDEEFVETNFFEIVTM